MQDHVAHDFRDRRHRDADESDSVGGRLLQWQSTGDADGLESLVRLIRQELETVVRRTLQRHGVTDRSAIDDGISLVLDHLRRLPGSSDGDRKAPTHFKPGQVRAARIHKDTGMAYVCWLARNRALDVVRMRRRDVRRAIPFSQLFRPPDTAIPNQDDGGSPPGPHDAASLRNVIPQLEPRLRRVIELLLDGHSQASIARRLHVCEGTVSRIRARAIERLRRLLNP